MKFSLDKKVSLYIVGILFTLAAIMGVDFQHNQEEVLSQELDERLSVLLDNLSRNLEYPVLVRDREAISRLVGGVLAQKEIVFCRVEGTEGGVLYQGGVEPEGELGEFTADIVTRMGGGGEGLILDLPGDAEKKIGEIHLRASLSGLNRKIHEVQKNIVAVVVVVILLSSLGACWLLKRLIGIPITALVEATRRVSRGDLAHKIPITSRDELGALAAAFNAMTDSLVDAQEELVRREKLATLGELAGSVGNELRNPLGVMNNAVFFLKTVLAGADETVKEYLEILQGEIDGSRRILSDFIDFFRTRPPRTKTVAAADLIEQSLGKFAIPENVTLQLDLPAALPPLRVDPVQMEQVLQNLLTNGVQAMPNGGALKIASRLVGAALVPDRVPQGQPQGVPLQDGIEISVADTGAGISPENMTRLFQPLFSTKSRGIGLGLPICKNLVEANGGRIEVKSEPGAGATFQVVLPVEEGGA